MSRADPERELQLRDDDAWGRCTIRTRPGGGGIDTLYTIQYVEIDRVESTIWFDTAISDRYCTVVGSS